MNLMPAGTHPMADHLLSADRLEIVHHGAATRRIEKVAALIEWPETYHGLHVCMNMKEYDGVQNCCRCEKCLRTMTMLEVLGVYDKYTTFKKTFSYADVLRWSRKYPVVPSYGNEVLGVAINRRKDLVPLVGIVIMLGWIRYALLRFLPQLLQALLKKRFSAASADALFAKVNRQ